MLFLILSVAADGGTAADVLTQTAATAVSADGETADPERYYAVDLDRVVDGADLLSDEAENALRERVRTMTLDHAADFVIVTTDDLRGKSAEAYADDFYDYGGYGVGDTRDGVLFLVSVEPGNRYYHISTTGWEVDGLAPYIDGMCEAVLSYLRNEDYEGAAWDFLSVTERAYEQDATLADVSYDHGSREGSDADERMGIIGRIAVAVVIALVVVLILRSKMKPVRQGADASTYLVDGSINIRRQREYYLRSVVTKTPRQTSSSSGGHSHTGSSGTSHGGGGGRF